MEERLFLDGIDVCGADAGVDESVVGSAAVFAHAAVAALLVAYRALARAELALDFVVRQFLVELCLEGKLRVILRLRA